MVCNLPIRRSSRSTLLRALALAAVLSAALLALMNSGVQPQPGAMERSSFKGGAGYWLLGKDGGVFAFGDAKYFGANRNQGRDIAGMAATASGNGYWTVDDDGDVFPYGDAVDYGSRPGPEIDDITGFAVRSQGDGYWMVAKNGAVYAFGAAVHFGSADRLNLTKPIVGMAATLSGKGYWLIAGDGGVFAYGDAKFHGSTGNIKLNKPIVDFGPSPDGKGYRFIGNDGGVFAYGDASFHGSTGAITLNQPIVGFAATATGKGYWLVGQDGGVFAFGDAQFHGSTGGITLNAPIVAIVATPRVNVAPVTTDDAQSLNEDSSATIDVEANDTHALPVSVSIEKKPDHGTATVLNGKVVYTPTGNYNGPDAFKYKLTDTVGHSAIGNVSVTVKPINDVPTISDVANQSTSRNTATGAINVTVGDVDTGDVLTLSASSSNTTLVPNANIALGGSGANRTVTVTPAANQSGTSTITLTVSDGNGGSASDTFVLTVNASPTISDVGNQSTNEDTATAALAFTVSDVETAAGSLTVTGSSSNTTLVPNASVVFGGSGANRTVTVTPAANLSGTSTITLTVSDGNGGTATDTFLLTVSAVNDAPVAVDGAASTLPLIPVSGSVTATDVDGPSLTYTLVAGPSSGAVLLNGDGTFLYTPTLLHGQATFTFKANDGSLDSNTATFTIYINNLPVAVDDNAVTVDGVVVVTVLVNDSDPDTDTLTLTPYIGVTAEGGSVVCAAGVCTYTAEAGFSGQDTFTYTITDGFGGTATGTVTITVP